MTEFLPKDYEFPASKSSSKNYFKLQKGENRFRILSAAVTGFEYWNTETKPVRSRIEPSGTPKDIKLKEDGTPSAVKHFWAFVVWNYAAEQAQILEITQKSVQDGIKAYVDNKKWGSPTEYDLIIKKVGEGLETSYTVIAEPKSDVPEGAQEAAKKINLLALFDGKDPFAASTVEYPENANDGDIPF